MDNKWECFCDLSYYDLWAVRMKCDKEWGHCFHLNSEEEAKGLCDLLNQNMETIEALKNENDKLRNK